MSINFTVKGLTHKITVKFVPAFLPEAKKPYYLRAVFRTELDVHGIAGKAGDYDIETDPRVIEEGFTAACKLIYYLAADGYKIKTPLFNLSIRLPGEYSGAETRLPEGVYPEVRIQSAAPLRQYIRDRVQVEIDGIEQSDDLIDEAIDEHTGQVDKIMTIGNILTVRGCGLKIEADKDHKDEAGLFFDNGRSIPVKTEFLAVNKPRTLKAIVPGVLAAGDEYTLKIVTQSSAKGNGGVLKTVREIRSDFKLTAQN
jgi:hypothetical protein